MSENDAGKVKIDGKLYDLPDDYTLREGMIFERMTGKTLAEADLTSATALAALVYLILRREDPSVEEGVLDFIKMSAVEPGADERPPVEDGGANPETAETLEVSGAPA